MAGRNWRRRLAVASAMAIGTALLPAVVTVGAKPARADAGAVRSGFDSTVFGPNDDGTYPCTSPYAGTPFGCSPSQIPLGFTVDYFGNHYSGVYLNNNGNLTFGSPLAAYTPFPLATTQEQMIAPFFADVDTRVGNPVEFGSGTVDGRPAWGATWPGAGCYDENDSSLNYFQVLLIDRSDVGPGAFDIEFDYNAVNWDSGQASGGDANCLGGTAARAGFTGGNGSYLELNGSGTDGAFLDSNPTTGLVNNSFNSSEPGRYVFQFRNGQPATTGTAPETGTAIGSGVAAVDYQACVSGGYPIDCASGNFTHSFIDESVPGRGPGLHLVRTYNSFEASTAGMFGPGWTSSYDMHLQTNADGSVTVFEEDGSQVTAEPDGAGGWTVPLWADSTLTRDADGSWTFVRHQGTTFTFDSAGRLSAESDRNGYTTLSRDPGGRLTAATDGSGRTLQFAYDASGTVSSVTDPDGRTTGYSYDAAGNLASTTDPMGRVARYTYDAGHRMLTMSDPLGGTVSNTYDPDGRVTQQTDPMGRVTSYSYSGSPFTAFGGATTITDPLGNREVQHYVSGLLMSLTEAAGTPAAATWRYTYDANSLGTTSITDPGGRISRMVHDQYGNLVSGTDPAGRTSTATYNAFDEPVTTTDPSGLAVTNRTYDTAGNLLSISTTDGATTVETRLDHGDPAHPGDVTAVTDADGHTTHLAYDSSGNLAAKTDPYGNTVRYTYDADSQQTSATTPSGRTTTYTYDADGEETAVTDPQGATSTTTYDADGNLVATTDPLGRTTRFTYDAGNEPTSVTRPDGSTSTTTYDADGNPVAQTDGNGHTTTKVYDALNRAIATVDALGRRSTATLDASGDVVAETDARGVTTDFTYDAGGAVTGISYSDGSPAVGFTYDADGRRATMTDGTGTSSYAYDPMGRLVSSTDGHGQHVGYTYDAMGNLTGLTYPDGMQVTRTYDADNRLVSVVDGAGRTTSYTYGPDSQPTSMSDPGAVTATYSYDGAGRLAGILDTAGTKALASFGYTRASNGQASSSTASGVPTPQPSQAYTYTPANQLESVNSDGYGYDRAGNLTSSPATAVTYDAADELVRSVAGPVQTDYSYDQAGNRTAQDGSGPGAQACVLCVLASTAAPALDLSGNSQASVGGTATVDSVAAEAVSASGAASLDATALYSPGGVTRNGGATIPAAVPTGGAALSPFDGTAPPTVDGPAATASVPGGDVTLQPGVYSSIEAGGSASVTLAPGTYVLTGRLDVSGDARVGGTGVTLYLACASYPDPCPAGGTGGSVSVTGQSHLALTGGAYGPGRGLVIAADPADTSAIRTDGGAGVDLTGSVGADAVALQVGGHSSFTMADGIGAVGTVTVTGSGRLAVDGAGSNALPATSYSYDGADRLTAVRSAAVDGTYTYDGDGLRATSTVNGTTAVFAYAQSSGVPAMLSDGTFDYVYGLGATPVEQMAAGSGAGEYLLQDDSGSTRLLVDTSGRPVGTYSYDAFGNLAEHTGPASTPMMFAGQYRDTGSGLYWLRARFYDPATAQFLSADPLASSTGLPYAYGIDDPLNQTDPSGLQSFPSYCADPTLLVVCLPTTLNFAIPAMAESYVATQQPGFASGQVTIHKYFSTTCGRRFVDVYDASTEQITEVKTGSQSGSSFILNQVAKDASLVAAGGGLTTGGAWDGVSSAEWDFYPNGAGVTDPSLPLLQALTAAGIPSFVYFSTPQTPVPVPVPVPVPEPAPEPAPAPSSGGGLFGWLTGGVIVGGLAILGKVAAGAICGGATIETGPGAVAAGAACAAAVP